MIEKLTAERDAWKALAFAYRSNAIAASNGRCIAVSDEHRMAIEKATDMIVSAGIDPLNGERL